MATKPTRAILRVAGAGLLVAIGAIHLDLYLTGYQTIPTIGWLFLLQVIAAFGLGLAVLAIPGRLVIGGRLAAGAGAGFALATLGGYLPVRPRHPDQLEVLRELRGVLAAGDRHRRGRLGSAGHDGRHRQERRLNPAHLRRSSALHLRRRQRPRPGRGHNLDLNLNGGLWHEVPVSGGQAGRGAG
jgi:hypothetical protein